MDQNFMTFLSILGGGAFLTFLQFLIKRRDENNGQIKQIVQAIQDIKEEINIIRQDESEDRANNARVRILRFSDECRHGVPHSKEHFDQLNLDIDKYRLYCTTHPEYQNNRSVQAIANIERIYQDCLTENKFLS